MIFLVLDMRGSCQKHSFFRFNESIHEFILFSNAYALTFEIVLCTAYLSVALSIRIRDLGYVIEVCIKK